MIRSLGLRPPYTEALVTLLAAVALTSAAIAQERTAAGLRVSVAEVGRSYDLSRKQELLTITVDVTGRDPAGLRRVQPLRDDFQVLAGKTMLPCRSLRGGSLPDDPNRLRFTLGFSMPPRGVSRVSLRANVPRLEGEDVLELRLTGMQLGQKAHERQGPGWKAQVEEFDERDYVPPALPPKGRLIMKGEPYDARVFQKPTPPGGAIERAILLSLWSRDTDLFDPTLDVSGYLVMDGAAASPLVSASMRRHPSRAAAKSGMAPYVGGQFWFAVPPRGRPSGAVIRLHRRPANPRREPVLFRDLPVPGSR
jgi:hypothetical protein